MLPLLDTRVGGRGPGHEAAGLRGALRLRQVILNLLSNAIKFTKEGTIWVRCWLEDDTDEAHVVRFEVEDTGVGMHASDCAKLFTLFT